MSNASKLPRLKGAALLSGLGPVSQERNDSVARSRPAPRPQTVVPFVKSRMFNKCILKRTENGYFISAILKGALIRAL